MVWPVAALVGLDQGGCAIDDDGGDDDLHASPIAL